jgi:hypothetical protein
MNLQINVKYQNQMLKQHRGSWSRGSTLGEYFPSNEETIFETLKPLGQYLSQAPFYVNVQPGRASARLGGASFSPVPLRRGIPGPWQAGSTVAVATVLQLQLLSSAES